MAVRISPCYRCPLGKDCQQRQELRRRVSGLGLRSATFGCAHLGNEMRPGRRIVINQPVLVEGGGSSWEPEEFVVKREVSATITSVSGSYRFACTVDKGAVGEVEFLADAEDKKRFRKTQPHYRIIRFLDEPDGVICAHGNVVRDGACDCLNGECACRSDTPQNSMEEARE